MMLKVFLFGNAARKVVLSAVLLLVGTGFVSASDDEILQRIKPAGSVCIEGQECKKAAIKKVVAVSEVTPAEKATPAVEVVASAASGEDTYRKTCAICHAGGTAGAPKLGDAAAWSVRAEKGLDGMLAVAKKGLNAMPPMGMCTSCSDDDLKAAITYMMDPSE
ncbi:MAG: c-type cytochrome [Pseudomonadales bacterium]|nr:c-type cytochrome [Pseudomonadales bacterium]